MNESKQCVKFRIGWVICFKRTKFGKIKYLNMVFATLKQNQKSITAYSS